MIKHLLDSRLKRFAIELAFGSSNNKSFSGACPINYNIVSGDTDAVFVPDIAFVLEHAVFVLDWYSTGNQE